MADIIKVEFSGDWSSELAQALKTAFDRADKMQHKLPAELMTMHGMSGKKFRALMNNLIEIVPNPRYLEIGCWAGSTFCSSIWQNNCQAVAVDNWSQFGGPRDQFLNNLKKFSNSENQRFIESDFRDIDYNNLGKFNVYMYDGPHEHDDQSDGLRMVLPALDDMFIWVVDDWNWPDPKNGTIDALTNVDVEVIAGIEIHTTDDLTHAKVSHEQSDWHNGYYIAILKKL